MYKIANENCKFSPYKLMRDNFERLVHAQGENTMKTIKAFQPQTNPPSALRDARSAALADDAPADVMLTRQAGLGVPVADYDAAALREEVDAAIAWLMPKA